MQERRNQLGLFWKAFQPLLLSGKKQSSEAKQRQSLCKAPGETQAPTPEIPCAFPSASECRGDFLLPPSHVREEALNFLKPEHKVVSPGFFRRLLPFMLHQLLEAFGWKRRNPFRSTGSLLLIASEAGFSFAQGPPVRLNTEQDPSQGDIFWLVFVFLCYRFRYCVSSGCGVSGHHV